MIFQWIFLITKYPNILSRTFIIYTLTKSGNISMNIYFLQIEYQRDIFYFSNSNYVSDLVEILCSLEPLVIPHVTVDHTTWYFKIGHIKQFQNNMLKILSHHFTFCGLGHIFNRADSCRIHFLLTNFKISRMKKINKLHVLNKLLF